ncbi:MAG: DUF4870 domain-containing protein [Symploca sp. SIO2B6]|nr:DUF4870 domain-containing protein [Symploca sp. SIO2B6]
MQSYDPETRRILSAVCHGACFFSATIVAIGIPIVILVTTNDSVIKANAREALNFQISIYIWAFICSILIVVLVGIPLLILVGIFSFIAPIIAIVKVLSEPDVPYRYELIFRFM